MPHIGPKICDHGEDIKTHICHQCKLIDAEKELVQVKEELTGQSLLYVTAVKELEDVKEELGRLRGLLMEISEQTFKQARREMANYCNCDNCCESLDNDDWPHFESWKTNEASRLEQNKLMGKG